MPYHASKFEKIPYHESWHPKLGWFWTTIGAKLPILPEKRFFGKFHLNDFYELNVCLHTEKSEKSPSSRSWDISLCDFGPPLAWSCTFGSKENFFFKFHWNDFYLFILPYHAEKFLKNSYEQILWYKLAQFCARIQPKLPIVQKVDFFENFTTVIFISLLCRIILQNMKKNPWRSLGQNCLFDLK